MAKPIKTLELHYQMIQFLIMSNLFNTDSKGTEPSVLFKEVSVL